MGTNSAYSMTRRKFISVLLPLIAAPRLWAADAEFKGIKYMAVPKIAARCSMKVRTVLKNKTVSIYNKAVKIDFEVNQRDIYINGARIWLGFPVALLGGNLCVSQIDYYKVIEGILYPKLPKNGLKLNKIVIDAGHGGKDRGAFNKKYNLVEKSLTLDMANRVASLLIKRGYNVVFTRKSDIYIPLDGRTAIANKAKADMFVSIHYNSSQNSLVSGVETFAMTPKGQYSSSGSKLTASCNKFYPANNLDCWNTLLSFYVNSSLKRATGAIDRGAKKARFAVLTDATMPAVLVECGFISAVGEGARIANPKYRTKIALGIVNGIVRYQTTITRLRGAAVKK